MTSKKPVVDRRSFIKGLMGSGLRYDQAVRSYDSVMSTIADGIVSGQAIYLGNIGTIKPELSPPRHVSMGFVRQKGGKVTKLKREYFLDSRLKYKFKTFKKFLATHQLDW